MERLRRLALHAYEHFCLRSFRIHIGCVAAGIELKISQ